MKGMYLKQKLHHKNSSWLLTNGLQLTYNQRLSCKCKYIVTATNV